MTSDRVAHVVVGTAAVMVLLLTLVPAAAPQANPLPRMPPKPYPAAPRLPDGTPNLGPTEPNKGYWHLHQFQDYKQLLLNPKEIPYQPWARALAMPRRADQAKSDPQGYSMRPYGPWLT